MPQLGTAEWAMLISLAALLVSGISLGWTIYSKFLHPKPQFSVSAAESILVGDGYSGDYSFIAAHVLNLGPGKLRVTQFSGVARYDWRWRATRIGLLNPLHGFPDQIDASIGPFGGGLPATIEEGESFSAYFTLENPGLASGQLKNFGANDSYGRFRSISRRQFSALCEAARKAVVAKAKNSAGQ